MLNRMCENCLCLNNGCAGTTSMVWTGCIFKETLKPEKESYMSKEEVSDIIDKLSNRNHGKAGQNQILA